MKLKEKVALVTGGSRGQLGARGVYGPLLVRFWRDGPAEKIFRFAERVRLEYTYGKLKI